MFIFLSHYRSDFVHLLGERFVHNVGIVERHSGIGMTEHLRHIFQLYIIRKRDSRRKGIAGCMHCQMLLYAAKIGDFLLVRIHLLIGIYREYRVISPTHRVVAILLNQL